MRPQQPVEMFGDGGKEKRKETQGTQPTIYVGIASSRRGIIACRTARPIICEKEREHPAANGGGWRKPRKCLECPQVRIDVPHIHISPASLRFTLLLAGVAHVPPSRVVLFASTKRPETACVKQRKSTVALDTFGELWMGKNEARQ